MDEDKPKGKKEEKGSKTLVVENLPTQQINKAIGDDGNEYDLITRDEALTEILETVRSLKKGLL
jgi:hypothetical protein